MTRRMILSLVLHGLLLVFVGMLLGLPLQRSITSEQGPGVEHAWRTSHTSLITGGTFYIALAAVAHRLVLGARAARLAGTALVLASYLFAVVFVAGPAIGARGLEPVGPPFHVAVYVGFVLAVLLLFTATGVVLWGAFAGLRAAREEQDPQGPPAGR